MDSVLSWFLALVGAVYGAYAFAKALEAELSRKASESEADWIRLETEWGR